MEEKIKLPRSLGLIVAIELRDKHGINIWQRTTGIPDFSFTREELNLISELEVKNPSEGKLEGVENLTNLKSLKIRGDQNTPLVHPEDISSIGDKDIKSISQCTSLKTLSISNQANISYVDVSRLLQLESLSITNNQHLEEICGLEKLHGLDTFRCKGNNRLFSIEGLDQFVLQNPDMYDMDLDVLLFQDAIGYNHITGEYNREALQRIQEIPRKS